MGCDPPLKLSVEPFRWRTSFTSPTSRCASSHSAVKTNWRALRFCSHPMGGLPLGRPRRKGGPTHRISIRGNTLYYREPEHTEVIGVVDGQADSISCALDRRPKAPRAKRSRCCARYGGLTPVSVQEGSHASSPPGRRNTPRPPSAWRGTGGVARLLRLPGGALAESRTPSSRSKCYGDVHS